MISKTRKILILFTFSEMISKRRYISSRWMDDVNEDKGGIKMDAIKKEVDNIKTDEIKKEEVIVKMDNINEKEVVNIREDNNRIEISYEKYHNNSPRCICRFFNFNFV